MTTTPDPVSEVMALAEQYANMIARIPHAIDQAQARKECEPARDALGK